MPNNRYENQTFEDEVIQLDGNQYVGCTFRRCRLQFGGLADTTLSNNAFHECSWLFTDAAERALNFMANLYHGAGEGGREMIDQTFENIHQRRPTSLVH